MTTIKKGDKVRVEYEGVVVQVLEPSLRCWNVAVQLPNGTATYVRGEHVSVVSPPEPEYETGEAYIDATGTAYQFFEADYADNQPEPVWNAFGEMNEIPFDVPRRPMRKLVPVDAASE